MFLRQLFDQESSTFSYLLADPMTHQAALIDPVLDQADRDLQLVQELGFQLVYALDTHVHADHVTGTGVLRERTGARVVSSIRGPVCADLHVRGGDVLTVGNLRVRVLETPGHTDDSVSYLVEDHVFTGDALLIRTAGRTDFQNGDPGQLYDSLNSVLFALPDETRVHPAHDYRGFTETTIGEEKRLNARAAGRNREAFITLMNGLGLPKPRKMDVAVPANRACGCPVEPAVDSRRTNMTASYENVRPDQLHTLPSETHWVDVREPDEYTGPLGHLEGSQLVPLSTLEPTAKAWPKERPLLLICRSGNRSGRAAEQLAAVGFTRLFNLEGGMIAVRAHEGTNTAGRA